MSPATDCSLDLDTHSPAQTHAVGRALGSLLQAGDVICLQGDLGSGKTCLTQGIGAGMRVGGAINSPTFVFICEHPPLKSGPYLYHVDLYRISDVSEVFSLGLDDYMYGDGVTVIEWAERASEILPTQRLWVTLEHGEDSDRTLSFEATGQRYLDLLRALGDQLKGARGLGQGAL